MFKTSWFKIWNWLEWNEGKAFCHTCRVAMELKWITFLKCTSDAFTVKGFSNWKHGPERFRGHEVSLSHKEATRKWLHYSRSTSFSMQILLAKQKEQAQAKKAFIKILEAIQFIGEQGLPFRNSRDADSLFVKLLNLRARDSATLQSWLQRREKYCSHEIQNKLLNIMASEVTRVLSARIRQNRFFFV